jgi:hypothetical protein
VTTATAQPVQKTFIGKIQYRGQVIDVPGKEALSRNEAKDMLEKRYPLVLNIWIGQQISQQN